MIEMGFADGGITNALRAIAKKNRSRSYLRREAALAEKMKPARLAPSVTTQSDDMLAAFRPPGKRRFAAIRPRMIEFADSRPRNPEGQFKANETGGADPDSMHAAYGPGTVAAIAGVGATAGVAGTLSAGKIKRGLAKFAKRV